MGIVAIIKEKLTVKQSKLHWAILAEDWNGCWRRLQKTNGAEARSFNEYGDFPLHFACYGGLAPPDIIRALIDAYPESVRIENNKGRYPLELARINYQIRIGEDEESLDRHVREEVLFLLRWYRPAANSQSRTIDDAPLPGIFSTKPPDQLYSASDLCVVCMEELSTVAMIPCGHVCLCMNCVSTAASSGKCPVDRCKIQGLYQLQGEQINIHAAPVQLVGAH